MSRFNQFHTYTRARSVWPRQQFFGGWFDLNIGDNGTHLHANLNVDLVKLDGDDGHSHFHWTFYSMRTEWKIPSIFINDHSLPRRFAI